jgi:hypothetical protein
MEGTVRATVYGNGRELLRQPLMEMDKHCLGKNRSNKIYYITNINCLISQVLFYYGTNKL